MTVYADATAATLQSSGFVLKPDVVSEAARARLLAVLEPNQVGGALRHRSGKAFAVRNALWKVPSLGSELEAAGSTALASAVLGAPAFPIDATYFDKCAVANWSVPGHQDRVLPVADRSDIRHRMRAGIVHAELDPETLADLVALRLHFDPTDARTGALCVVPGSHAGGIMTNADVRSVSMTDFVPCSAVAGDVLVMRPLLLHRSSPFHGEGHRRVLHVVYATRQPRCAARWREVV